MAASQCSPACLVRHAGSPAAARTILFMAFLTVLPIALPVTLIGQIVPPALESPAAGPPQTGSEGQKLIGMPKFHEPAPYDIDEHTGFTQIFDGKSLTGWDADTSIWRVEDGIMVGETFEGKPKGNNYIVYRDETARDFNLKLQMKIEKGGGGGIQYRSVTGVPWTRPQPKGQPPY
ncbi:MAG: family 16 glycoside hydrolase, partial [Terracidiphilus sp.]